MAFPSALTTQTQASIELLPPQNEEAEQSVLGCILLDGESMVNVADAITGEDFYFRANRLVFEAMIALFEKREPIDILSISNQLGEDEHLKAIGGRAYLVSLSNTVPNSSNIAHYAGIIRKKAVLRRLINAANNIEKLGYDESDDVEQTLDMAEQELFNVSQKFLKKNFTPITDVLTEAFERIDELHQNKGQIRGVPTGYVDLDNTLAGFQKSDLIILAARPSMGKTSLALDFARNVAVGSKIAVGVFSLEMSKEQLVDRLLCAQAGVDLWKMRTGQLSNTGDTNDFERIGEAMGVLSEAPIFIDDSPGANIMEIRSKARRLHSEHNLGFLVIDYLQLMEGRSRENRVQEVSEISRALKGIARELNIPVLALSQLSRAVEQRNDPIPQLSDLRESGSIEQDADVVMFIYRESKNKRPEEIDPATKNIAEIHIKKQRNGPTGAIQLYFEESSASFRNLDSTHGQRMV
jgi:replicative DNA helicase